MVERKMNKVELDQLDGLFAELRAIDVTPSDDLMARVLHDANQVQTSISAQEAQSPGATPRFAALWGMLGGWGGASGLVAATVTGIWIGFAPPDALSGVSATILGETVSVSIFSSDDVLGLEG